MIPQSFAQCSEKGEVLTLAIKIADEPLLTGIANEMRKFITKFNDKFELGEAVHGPGDHTYNGMNIIQENDFTVCIHSYNKIQAIERYALSRIRNVVCDEKNEQSGN